MERVTGFGGILFKARDPKQIKEYEHGCFGWLTDPEGNRIELWEPPKGTAGRPADEEE